MARLLIITGTDRIAQRFFAEVFPALNDSTEWILDVSGGLSRVLKLIRNRRVSIAAVARMSFAELLRPVMPFDARLERVGKSQELRAHVERIQPDEVLCFRAGMILPRTILDMPPTFLNIHAARLPDYGGLGAIQRARLDREFHQLATLHTMVPKVDAGEVLQVEPYQLDPRWSYRACEEVAYGAAIRLAWRFLEQRGYLSTSGLTGS